MDKEQVVHKTRYIFSSLELIGILNSLGYTRQFSGQIEPEAVKEHLPFYFNEGSKSYGYVNILPEGEVYNIAENKEYLRSLGEDISNQEYLIVDVTYEINSNIQRRYSFKAPADKNIRVGDYLMVESSYGFGITRALGVNTPKSVPEKDAVATHWVVGKVELFKGVEDAE